jgi:hypothetical protein
VRLVGPGEGITFSDRNFEPCLHRGLEALEFADPGDAVITDQGHAAPFFGRRLDAVGVRNTAAGPKHTQAAFQPVSAGESQDRIDAVQRKTTRVIVDIGRLPSTAACAPISRTSSTPSLPDAVANTRAPRILANCTASVPTPPEAP